jgi:chorismate synthase
LSIKQKLNNIHEGCFLFYRISLKPTPSLTIEMITVESQENNVHCPHVFLCFLTDKIQI